MDNLATFYSSECKNTLINSIPCKLFLEQTPQLAAAFSNNLCEVCNKDDQILLLNCEICGVIIHNYCYDIETFSQPWICQACVWTLLTKENCFCEICKNFKGALRKGTNGWIHSLCEKWKKYAKSEENWCKLCEKLDFYCVKCEDCEAFYHPFCGFLKGLRIFDGVIKCPGHSGVDAKIETKNDKNMRKFLITENSEALTIDAIAPQSQLGQPYKKQKLDDKKETKKKTENNTKKDEKKFSFDKQTTNLQNPDGNYIFDSKIQKLLKTSGKGTIVQLSNKLEHFLLWNSTLKSSFYEIPAELKNIFNRQKIHYYEFPEIVYDYSNIIL